MGAFASQYVYLFFNNLVLLNTKRFIKIFIDISLNSVLCYFYCITVATLYANIMAGRHKPSLDKDFVIILGCKIKPDGTLTPLLKGRVDKALEFGMYSDEKQKEAQELFENYENPKDLFPKYTIKGSQFCKPKFEFSGSCAGCGETPYIKLLTQLFGHPLTATIGYFLSISLFLPSISAEVEPIQIDITFPFSFFQSPTATRDTKPLGLIPLHGASAILSAITSPV